MLNVSLTMMYFLLRNTPGCRRLALVGQLCLITGCAAFADRGAAELTQSPVATAVPATTTSVTGTPFMPESMEFPAPLASGSRSIGTPLATLNTNVQRVRRGIHYGVLEWMHAPRKEAWDQWAADHLQDGDIVFLQCEDTYVLRVINFSNLSRAVTESDFTHVGVVAVEGGQVYVYDIDFLGPGRTSFGTLMVDPNVVAVAVKRLRRRYRDSIGPALDYCRRVYQAKLPFDRRLKLGNDRLYCAELVEIAFRQGGQPLSQPVRWDELPQIDKHPLRVRLIQWANGSERHERVVIPGNERMGLWSSPQLQLVLPLTKTEFPPASLQPDSLEHF